MPTRFTNVKNVISRMIDQQSSAVAINVASAITRSLETRGTPSSPPVSGLDFSSSLSTTGFADRRSVFGFVWGEDTWGDGTFSLESALAESSGAIGVDTTGLGSGDRGGVVRRF